MDRAHNIPLMFSKVDYYQRKLKREGFEEVLKLPFRGRAYDEHLFVFFHRQHGILLNFDTFRGDQVNGGDLYYNWHPYSVRSGESGTVEYNSYTAYTFNGNLDEHGIWAGFHDCRGGMYRSLLKLKKNGDFITPWVRSPALWLLHYMDTKPERFDAEAINQDRLALLPVDVAKALGPAVL